MELVAHAGTKLGCQQRSILKLPSSCMPARSTPKRDDQVAATLFDRIARGRRRAASLIPCRVLGCRQFAPMRLYRSA